jgi:universal stress protein A
LLAAQLSITTVELSHSKAQHTNPLQYFHHNGGNGRAISAAAAVAIEAAGDSSIERVKAMLAIKTILCPTDFSEPSREALKFAVELASHFAGEICLVNVVPVVPSLASDPNFVFAVPEYERMLHAEAEEKLRGLVKKVTTHGVAVRTKVRHGDAATEIVRIAADEKADLIVMATHGMTGWRHAMFGSVAEKVVRLAKCPVLTTRASAELAKEADA